MDREEMAQDTSIKKDHVILERKLSYDPERKLWQWSSEKTLKYSKTPTPAPSNLLEILLESSDLQAPISRNTYSQDPSMPLPKLLVKDESNKKNEDVLSQLLESSDLQVEYLPLMMPKPIMSIVPKIDSGVESMVSFDTRTELEEDEFSNHLELMKTYLVPNKTNKMWVRAKLLHMDEDVLFLADNVHFKSIQATPKRIAYAEPPTELLDVGNRVVALKRTIASTGEISSGRGRHEMGVVAEIPTTRNLLRYLIIFDDGDWGYVNPNEVHLMCYQSRKPWDDVPDCNKNLVRNFLNGLYDPICDFDKQDLVVYEVSPNVFQEGVVVNTDRSLIYVFFNGYSKCIVTHKGLVRLTIR